MAMKLPLLTWKIEASDVETLLHLEGIINEDFAFRELASQLRGREHLKLKLNLREIRRINSMGIREWFNFLKELSWPSAIILSECSLIFTEVLSQIEELGQGCYVETCYLSVWCDSCEEEFEVQMDLSLTLPQQPTTVPCPKCGAECRVETWSIEEIVRKQTS